jgi:hypothetical protein
MLFILWIALLALVGALGKDRKIGGAGALFCAILLSPLVGLLVVLLSDKFDKNQRVMSVADELQMLKKLYDDDVLTRTEYDAQKAHLLGIPNQGA